MTPFTPHIALNLLWLAIGVCLFAWFVRAERKRLQFGRWRRVLAIGALIITLFPSVSDTDDLFHFSLLQVPGHWNSGFGTAPPEESREKGTIHLAHLLETLDHYQVAGLYAL